jgi:hypothetical protein
MKHILAALALGGMLASPANAQLDKSPWYGTPMDIKPDDVLSREQLRAERDRYRAMERAQAAMKPGCTAPG